MGRSQLASCDSKRTRRAELVTGGNRVAEWMSVEKWLVIRKKPNEHIYVGAHCKCISMARVELKDYLNYLYGFEAFNNIL